MWKIATWADKSKHFAKISNCNQHSESLQLFIVWLFIYLNAISVN